MSANQNRPHIIVIPEDNANRELANGFQIKIDHAKQRQMQIERPAGGWIKASDQLEGQFLQTLVRFPERLVILLVDCDGRLDRLDKIRAKVPADLTDRVFVLGAATNPERMKSALALSLEQIGQALADDCRNSTSLTWSQPILKHNLSEVERIRPRVGPILF